MTRAEVAITESRCSLKVHGHATGSPAVCAAVSAAVYTLVGYMANAGEHLTDVEKCELSSGSAEIVCAGDEVIKGVYEMTAVGFLQLAKQYPEYITAEYSKKS